MEISSSRLWPLVHGRAELRLETLDLRIARMSETKRNAVNDEKAFNELLEQTPHYAPKYKLYKALLLGAPFTSISG